MKDTANDSRINEHMANERTFLAWIRTNIGIIAFGFVIEKFGLFIKQMGLILGKTSAEAPQVSHGYSAMIGIVLICFGILMNLLAYLNFIKIKDQIEKHSASYKPSGVMYALIIAAMLIAGILLVVYLAQNKL